MTPLEYELNRLDNLNRYKRNKTDSFYYSLNKIEPKDWFLFGSLTWKRESRRKDSDFAQKNREYDFKKFLIKFCADSELKLRHLAYYRTTEFGEAGEIHFHFLIARHRVEKLDAEATANYLERLWTEELKTFDGEQLGAGTAVIRTYDAAKGDRGVNYCLKREFDEFYEPRDRNDFLSNSLIKVIQKKSDFTDASLN